MDTTESPGGEPSPTGENHAGSEITTDARSHAASARRGGGRGGGRTGPGRRNPPGDRRGAVRQPDLYLPLAGPVSHPRSAAQRGHLGVPRHPRPLRGPAEPGRERRPDSRGGYPLCGFRRQHDLHLHAPRGRQVVERRSGYRARLRLCLAACGRSLHRLALCLVPRADRDGERQGGPGRQEGSHRARREGR